MAPTSLGCADWAFCAGWNYPEPDGKLLQEALGLHDLIAQQMRAQEKRMAAEFKV